mmetsp:Transcript_12175/g.14506  ORF Transcript_12175/g.14506 Transcript_12175/m.14506 type:complete len:387 (-) Transcript_12175:4868-6028(-)
MNVLMKVVYFFSSHRGPSLLSTVCSLTSNLHHLRALKLAINPFTLHTIDHFNRFVFLTGTILHLWTMFNCEFKESRGGSSGEVVHRDKGFRRHLAIFRNFRARPDDVLCILNVSGNIGERIGLHVSHTSDVKIMIIVLVEAGIIQESPCKPIQNCCTGFANLSLVDGFSNTPFLIREDSGEPGVFGRQVPNVAPGGLSRWRTIRHREHITGSSAGTAQFNIVEWMQWVLTPINVCNAGFGADVRRVVQMVREVIVKSVHAAEWCCSTLFSCRGTFCMAATIVITWSTQSRLIDVLHDISISHRMNGLLHEGNVLVIINRRTIPMIGNCIAISRPVDTVTTVTPLLVQHHELPISDGREMRFETQSGEPAQGKVLSANTRTDRLEIV